MAIKTELFRFTEKDSAQVWTYTSGNEVVSYNAGFGLENYTPIPVGRTEVETRKELVRANIELTVPLDNIMGLKWLADHGEMFVFLTIFERATNGDISVVWKGRLVNTVPGMTNIMLRFESVFTSLRRSGIRARYQKSCRHALYGPRCRLNAEDFAVAGTLTAATGTVVTVTQAALQPNGYYVGGMLRSPDGVLSFIVDHVGTQITLQTISYSLVSNMSEGFPVAVQIYPGCDRNRQTCIDKFNNLLNYGGFDWIPEVNPVGGTSIV